MLIRDRDSYVDQALAACTNSGMTKAQKLRAAYLYVRDHGAYLARPHQARGTTAWAEESALFMFEHKKGNCYCFAGQFLYMARRLGYNAYVAVSYTHLRVGYSTICSIFKYYDKDYACLLYTSNLGGTARMIWNKSKQPADPQQDAAAAPKKGGAAAFAQKNWKWLVPVAIVVLAGGWWLLKPKGAKPANVDTSYKMCIRDRQPSGRCIRCRKTRAETRKKKRVQKVGRCLRQN